MLHPWDKALARCSGELFLLAFEAAVVLGEGCPRVRRVSRGWEGTANSAIE